MNKYTAFEFSPGDWALIHFDGQGEPRVSMVWSKETPYPVNKIIELFETVSLNPEHPLSDAVRRIKVDLCQ